MSDFISIVDRIERNQLKTFIHIFEKQFWQKWSYKYIKSEDGKICNTTRNYWTMLYCFSQFWVCLSVFVEHLYCVVLIWNYTSKTKQISDYANCRKLLWIFQYVVLHWKLQFPEPIISLCYCIAYYDNMWLISCRKRINWCAWEKNGRKILILWWIIIWLLYKVLSEIIYTN